MANRFALLGAIASVLVAIPVVSGEPAAAQVRRAPVVLIVMENEPFTAVVGNPNAPYINQTMIANGLLATNDIAVPGSLPDYLLMVSGRKRPPPTAPNLFVKLGTSVSWREYMESMPSACYLGLAYSTVHGTHAALYAQSHNPAIQFSGVTRTRLCRRVVPLTPSTFSARHLPAFSLVVPNECNDMHTMPTDQHCPSWTGTDNQAGTEVALGDQWLAGFVPAVARTATVIVVWDEGRLKDERVAMVEYGVGVKPGQVTTRFGQASLEAGLYKYFGLGRPPWLGASSHPVPIP